eukprot:ctg_1042.g392
MSSTHQDKRAADARPYRFPARWDRLLQPLDDRLIRLCQRGQGSRPLYAVAMAMTALTCIETGLLFVPGAGIGMRIASAQTVVVAGATVYGRPRGGATARPHFFIPVARRDWRGGIRGGDLVAHARVRTIRGRGWDSSRDGSCRSDGDDVGTGASRRALPIRCRGRRVTRRPDRVADAREVAALVCYCASDQLRTRRRRGDSMVGAGDDHHRHIGVGGRRGGAPAAAVEQVVVRAGAAGRRHGVPTSGTVWRGACPIATTTGISIAAASIAGNTNAAGAVVVGHARQQHIIEAGGSQQVTDVPAGFSRTVCWDSRYGVCSGALRATVIVNIYANSRESKRQKMDERSNAGGEACYRVAVTTGDARGSAAERQATTARWREWVDGCDVAPLARGSTCVFLLRGVSDIGTLDRVSLRLDVDLDAVDTGAWRLERLSVERADDCGNPMGTEWIFSVGRWIDRDCGYAVELQRAMAAEVPVDDSGATVVKVRLAMHHMPKESAHEDIFVSGSIAELGDWNVERAVRMEKVMPVRSSMSAKGRKNSGCVASAWRGDWEYRFTLHPDHAADFEYKYFIRNRRTCAVIWEHGPNRKMVIERIGNIDDADVTVKLDDQWNTPTMCRKVLNSYLVNGLASPLSKLLGSSEDGVMHAVRRIRDELEGMKRENAQLRAQLPQHADQDAIEQQLRACRESERQEAAALRHRHASGLHDLRTASARHRRAAADRGPPPRRMPGTLPARARSRPEHVAPGVALAPQAVQRGARAERQHSGVLSGAPVSAAAPRAQRHRGHRRRQTGVRGHLAAGDQRDGRLQRVHLRVRPDRQRQDVHHERPARVARRQLPRPGGAVPYRRRALCGGAVHRRGEHAGDLQREPPRPDSEPAGRTAGYQAGRRRQSVRARPALGAGALAARGLGGDGGRVAAPCAGRHPPQHRVVALAPGGIGGGAGREPAHRQPSDRQAAPGGSGGQRAGGAQRGGGRPPPRGATHQQEPVGAGRCPPDAPVAGLVGRRQQDVDVCECESERRGRVGDAQLAAVCAAGGAGGAGRGHAAHRERRPEQVRQGGRSGTGGVASTRGGGGDVAAAGAGVAKRVAAGAGAADEQRERWRV